MPFLGCNRCNSVAFPQVRRGFCCYPAHISWTPPVATPCRGNPRESGVFEGCSSFWCCYTPLSGRGVTTPFVVSQSAPLHVLGTEAAMLYRPPPRIQTSTIARKMATARLAAPIQIPAIWSLRPLSLCSRLMHPSPSPGWSRPMILGLRWLAVGRLSLGTWPVSTGGPPGAERTCMRRCSAGERFSPKTHGESPQSGVSQHVVHLRSKFWGILGYSLFRGVTGVTTSSAAPNRCRAGCP